MDNGAWLMASCLIVVSLSTASSPFQSEVKGGPVRLCPLGYKSCSPSLAARTIPLFQDRPCTRFQRACYCGFRAALPGHVRQVSSRPSGHRCHPSGHQRHLCFLCDATRSLVPLCLPRGVLLRFRLCATSMKHSHTHTLMHWQFVCGVPA